MTAALALAFGAGLVATVNPCGFAMLPAYLSYFMGLRSDDASRAGAIRTALVVGIVVSLGFLVVFGIAGIIITGGFRAVTGWIPWIALGVGLLIGLLGLAMALGYEPKVVLPAASRARTGNGLRPVLGFGIGYGVASLSCTLPVFLVAVAGQLTQQSLLGGIAVFLAYAAGMSFMLLTVTIILALGKQTIVGRLRASSRHINRISGAILVLAGAFIVWFWTTEITSGATVLGESAAFRGIERIQSTLLNFIADRTLLVGGVFATTIGIAAVYAMTCRSPTAPDTDRPAVASDPQERDLIDVDARSD